MKPVPQEWIKEYIDKLLGVAKQLPHTDKMHHAILLRVDHIIDLVKAWREHEKKERGTN